MANMRRIIAHNLKATRLAMGITQLVAARQCGITERSYGKIERGQDNITLDTIVKLMEGLNITWQQLGQDEGWEMIRSK